MTRQPPAPALATRAWGALALACLALASPASGQPGGGPVPVVVAPLVERSLPATIRVVGNIQPDRRATVAAEVLGPVAAFDIEEGDALAAGDVICRIDPEVAELSLREAQAELDSLEAQLAELEAGTRQETIDELRAVVEEAEALFAKWRFERERIDELMAARQGNRKEQFDADQEFFAARGRLAQARAALTRAENGPRAEEIARARHAVAAQKATVARLQRDLNKTQIRAPFDGVLVRQDVEVGEWIEAGGPVGELIALKRVEVRVDVPESAVPYSVPGAPASVRIDALDRTLTAAIARTVPLANPAARTFPVEIDLDNPDGQLLPGMFVRVDVPAGPDAARLLAPADAIVPQGVNSIVFVLRQQAPDAPPLAIPTPVETGLQVGDAIEVRSTALSAGDQVVIRANERLMGPTPVAPSAGEPPPSAQASVTD